MRCEVGSVTGQLIELEPQDGEARNLRGKARDLKQRADRADDLRKKIEQSSDYELTDDDLKILRWDRASTEAALMKVEPADRKRVALDWIDTTRTQFRLDASNLEASRGASQGDADLRGQEGRFVAAFV